MTNPPNVMQPGTWVLLGVVVLAALAGVALIIYRVVKAQPKWKPLEGTMDARFAGKGFEPDGTFLASCFKQSIVLLLKHCTAWPPLSVARALRDVDIYVMAQPKWVDAWGRTIAGAQEGRVLVIGNDFAALLHECAHRCEEIIDNERDMDHVTWAADGIRAAENEYHTWLRELPQ
jgi:hypothetical protein